MRPEGIDLGRFALKSGPLSADVLAMTGTLTTARPLATSGSRVVAIHDRLGSGTTGGIGHVVVAPTGVWVIGTQHNGGRVARKDVGGLLGTDVRLYVGGCDRSGLVPAIWKEVAALRGALGTEWADVPVRPMLCFVGSNRGWLARPFELHGVVVAWPEAARALLARPGPYRPDRVERMAAALEERLRRAS